MIPLFTPGPWMVTDDGDGLCVMSHGGDFICTPHGNTVGQEIDNASLIAAAPDLLEALERIFNDDGLTGQDRIFFIEGIARDAINQALGKP